jgi:hypothetical protein
VIGDPPMQVGGGPAEFLQAGQGHLLTPIGARPRRTRLG